MKRVTLGGLRCGRVGETGGLALRLDDFCFKTRVGLDWMKTFTGFFSIIALGLIAGAVFTTTLSHTFSQFLQTGGQGSGLKVDYVSLLLGIVIGALISNLAGMEWSRIPRRVAAWLVDNADNFGYVLLAGILGCVVIYY